PIARPHSMLRLASMRSLTLSSLTQPLTRSIPHSLVTHLLTRSILHSCPNTESIACIFISVSSHSAFGSDASTIPPPAYTHRRRPSTRAHRRPTHISPSPFGSAHPMPPQYQPRSRLSCFDR